MNLILEKWIYFLVVLMNVCTGEDNILLTESAHSVALNAPCKKCLSSTIKAKRYPFESEDQSRAIMVWPSPETWDDEEFDGIREEIANIAKAISKYQPVDMLVNFDQVDEVRKALGTKVTMIPMESNDLWARDTMPVFLENLNDKTAFAVNFNFNGWGNKQKHDKDAKLAQKIAAHYNLKCVDSHLVGEGGAIESDGLGTLLLTESSWINENRNPGKSREDVEKQFKELLGVTKVIWIEGIKDYDITDMHIDAVARFVMPGTIAITRPFKFDSKEGSTIVYQQTREVFKNATDARGEPINVIEITEPNPDLMTVNEVGGPSPDFLSSYLNYVVVNGAVIMPKFGDVKADAEAQRILQQFFRNRDIIAVNIDTLAEHGGRIHCATSNIIKEMES